MTYEEAWNKSKGWIKHYFYNVFTPKRIYFDDYFQECALCFYASLKPKYEPFVCWCYSKIAYKRVMIKFLYRDKEQTKKYLPLDENKIGMNSFSDNEWEVDLRPSLKRVAECIIDGCETKEIAQRLNYTIETVYSYVRDIKKIYVKACRITNYQRKHLRSFTRNRTEKELENWKKNKERLAQIAKLRQKTE